MNIHFERKNRTLIVVINGEIDHHTSEEIKTKTEKEFVRGNYKNIVFDFSNVGFMDSSGIGMVIGRYKLLRSLGGTVAVAKLTPEVGRIFNISGLGKIINGYHTIEEAIKNM